MHQMFEQRRLRVLTSTKSLHRMRPPPRLIVSFAVFTIPCIFAQTDSLSTILPPSLIDVIPSCSAFCLEYFVILNYPPFACPNTQDIDCLCSTNTNTGFTLGEAALRCVVSACPGNIEATTQAYTVCSGIPDALPNTHSTITATLMATTTYPVASAFPTSPSPSPTSSDIPNPSITFSGTSIATDAGTAFLSFPSTSISTTTMTTAMASADPQLASSSSTPSPTSNGSLTTAQIVGIVMAGVASAVIAFGVLLFIYCLRRRRRLKRQSDNSPFQTEKAPPKTPPKEPRPRSPSPDQALGLNIGGDSISFYNPNQVFPAPSTDMRRSFWRKSIKPEEIGIAVSPETKQDSPASFASTRTASRLLPEKLSYSLFPAPLRISRQPIRPTSTATEFEDDFDAGRRSYVAPPVMAQTQQSSTAPQWPSQIYYDNLGQSRSEPRVVMYAAERYTNFPTTAPIRRGSIARAPTNQPQFPQPAATWTAQSRPMLSRIGPPTAIQQRAPSSTYTENYSLPSSEPRKSLISPIQEPAQRTNHERIQSVRDSHASDTSFEFDEDESPPEQLNKTLSTVMESPTKQTSPLSELKYPKLPRPASMSKNAGFAPVPLKSDSKSLEQSNIDSRQPRPRDRQEPPPLRTYFSTSSSSRDESPSSLLAKRRGDAAAEIIEKGLRIRPDINTSTSRKWKVVKKEAVKALPTAKTSPRRKGTAPSLSRENSDETYGTPRHRRDRAANIYAEALKSPTWEPKLTPTRRGDDLFISVD
jgi:hypothetical protein